MTTMTMKILTKRGTVGDTQRDSAILQHTMNRLRGFALVPKGLYRFKTREESNQWMIQQIAATHARLNLKT
jgi:hypothetical protein